MSDLTIRVATPDDMDAIRELRIAVFVHEQGVPAELELDELDKVAVHAAAVEGGVLIGTGRLTRSEGGARIGRLAVRAAHRRRGVGSAILRLLEEEARARGARHVELHAQTHALAFYRGIGYVEEGDLFEEAGIEHVMMRKLLE